MTIKKILISAGAFIIGILASCDGLPWHCHTEISCAISSKNPGDNVTDTP